MRSLRRSGAKFSHIQEAFVGVFPPPPVQGRGTIGGFKLHVEDRGDVGLDDLYENTQAFLGAASKKPEIAGSSPVARSR